MTPIRALLDRLSPLPPPDSPRLGWRQWGWLPVVWCCVLLLFSLQPWVAGWMPLEDALVRFGLARLAPWIVVAPLAVWLSVRFPIAGRRWSGALALHVAVCFVLIAGMAWLQEIYPPRRPLIERFMAERAPPAFQPPPERESGEIRPGPPWRPPGGFGFAEPRRWWALWDLRVGGRHLPFYWTLIAAAHVLYFQVVARRAATLQSKLTAARLAALQTQLQPHFLFNALNAVSALVRLKPAVADDMICALGALLHGVLDTTDRAEVTLAEELQLADHYLKIQAIRFGTALQIELQIEPASRAGLVPTLVLQPLLENAVTHGLRGEPGRIRIATRQQDGRLWLEVSDFPQAPALPPGPELATKGGGIGLANIRERLATLHGAKAELRFELRTDGATATIELPFRVPTGAPAGRVTAPAPRPAAD